MKITFLGTGTSQGVPLINCDCPVCISADPRNKRMRTSITIQTDKSCILVDTAPDLRLQLLRNPLPRVDAVLFTHSHADHIYGLDDLRRFNYLQNERIKLYAAVETLHRLRHIFDYSFGEGPLKPGLPNFQGIAINGSFQIGDAHIAPVQLKHGNGSVLGFRIGKFAYCTDTNFIPDESMEKLKNLDILVLDALREKPHPTHFSLEESISVASGLASQKTYFIHMSHKIDHAQHSAILPENMYFAYDGLILTV